ncbi:MAG: glycosyltransferase family 4 protein [Alphaproteobacteria bacterium]
MNILYLDHYAGSLSYGRSFRPHYLGREWVKDGHNVTVVGSRYSHLRQKQPAADQETIEGIQYLWLPGMRYQGNGLQRIMSMFVFIWQLLFNTRKIMSASQPDTIIASTVYMMDIFPAWLYKKLSKKPVKIIFELHDIWPLSPQLLGNLSPYNPFILFLKLVESCVYRIADKVVSILPNAYEYVQQFGVQEEDYRHIPNGVNLADWAEENIQPLPKPTEDSVGQIKADYDFLVGYAGHVNLGNQLESLIAAAPALAHKKVAIVILGDGPEKKSLQQRADGLESRNIFFLDPISKQSIPAFLHQMDALYFGLNDHELYKYGISLNKMYDYMMAGKPIVAAVPNSNNLISQQKCGVVVPPGNSEAVARAVLELSNVHIDIKSGKDFVISNCNYAFLAKKFMA